MTDTKCKSCGHTCHCEHDNCPDCDCVACDCKETKK